MDTKKKVRAGKLFRTSHHPPVKSVWLRHGSHTQVGPQIEYLATRLKGQNNLEKAKHLAKMLLLIKKRTAPRKEWAAKYPRKAEDILKSHEIQVSKKMSILRNDGCTEYATVAVAVLRHLGMEARFVRSGHHSYCFFKYEKQWYRFDPLTSYPTKKGELVTKVADFSFSEIILIDERIHKGRHFHGTDARDIGLNFETRSSPTNTKRLIKERINDELH